MNRIKMIGYNDRERFDNLIDNGYEIINDREKINEILKKYLLFKSMKLIDMCEYIIVGKDLNDIVEIWCGRGNPKKVKLRLIYINKSVEEKYVNYFERMIDRKYNSTFKSGELKNYYSVRTEWSFILEKYKHISPDNYKRIKWRIIDVGEDENQKINAIAIRVAIIPDDIKDDIRKLIYNRRIGVRKLIQPIDRKYLITSFICEKNEKYLVWIIYYASKMGYEKILRYNENTYKVGSVLM